MVTLILHNNHTVSYDYGITQGLWKHLSYRYRPYKYEFACSCGMHIQAKLQWQFRAAIDDHIGTHLGPIK